MENEKALVDIAYDVLKTYYKSKKKKNMVKVPFKEILEKVGEEKGIDSQQQLIDLASTFYTALTIDGRFFQKSSILPAKNSDGTKRCFSTSSCSTL